MTDIAGSYVAQHLDGVTDLARERAVLAAVDAGAFPAALAHFVLVSTQARDAAGVEHLVEYEVTPDYFALGTDADPLRMPMWPLTAQRLADAWECILPTARMVDQIHAQAARIVMPTSDVARDATATYYATSRRIDVALAKLGLAFGALASGQRKDIVLDKGQVAHPGNVVIYGGLTDAGTWWQTAPNAVSHFNRYEDYSHGVRLVRWRMWIDGAETDVRTVLRDPALAPLLSADGALAVLAYPTLPTP